MTIEEIRRLAEDEKSGRLRNPETLSNESIENLMMAHKQLVFVVDKIIRNPHRNQFLTNSLFLKLQLKNCGIKSLRASNKNFDTYEISSEFCDGTFFDAHKIFDSSEYPSFIKPHYCYDNTRRTIPLFGLKAKILSGIVFIGKPFLHSVILCNDKIIDYNYDLVMTKDLYFRLTHFEVLSELSFDQIRKNRGIISKMEGVESHIFNFAFEELMRQERVKQGVNDGAGV